MRAAARVQGARVHAACRAARCRHRHQPKAQHPTPARDGAPRTRPPVPRAADVESNPRSALRQGDQPRTRDAARRPRHTALDPTSHGALRPLHEGHQPEHEEEQAAHDGHLALRDAGREHAPADDREARAQGVAEGAAQGDPERVLRRGERDGGDLGAVAPLGEEGECEGLHKGLRQPRFPPRGLLGAPRGLQVVAGPVGAVLLFLTELSLHLLQLVARASALHLRGLRHTRGDRTGVSTRPWGQKGRPPLRTSLRSRTPKTRNKTAAA
mmetsp:Transcript_3508/g.11711  ORF Transcript_3508/g.11711 Transcript_3508/m.11711 type:complete len:269 (+) Transcript_3508:499-1305(+)